MSCGRRLEVAPVSFVLDAVSFVFDGVVVMVDVMTGAGDTGDCLIGVACAC